MSKIIVAALYKFANQPDYLAFQPKLLRACKKHGVKGTLLLAKEGINGTIAGTRGGIDAVLNFIRLKEIFSDLEHKESFADEMPFLRMKVRLKKEIVTMGVENTDPTAAVGTYLTPQEWNDMIKDENTILIDCRNDYEYQIGTFKNAINPKTETFREFPAYVEKTLMDKKNKNIAMCCTGGIRCERSTSLLKQWGFENVYHLKGGILKYLEEMPKEDSLWEGECFVFDNRVAVKHGLELGSYDQCYGCRYPISQEEKESDLYLEGVHCPKCYHKRTPEQQRSAAARQKQMNLAKEKNIKHLGR